jgi:hypothetical protein
MRYQPLVSSALRASRLWVLALLMFASLANAAIKSFNFSTTTLGSTTAGQSSGPFNPANGVTSISGASLTAGDVVIFDGVIANYNHTGGDNWGAIEFNGSGTPSGLTAATFGVLARTGSYLGLPCALWLSGVSSNLNGTAEINTNRVRIELYVSTTGSTANLGYLVKIDQGFSGVWTSSLSGTNLMLPNNTIPLQFGAYQAVVKIYPTPLTVSAPHNILVVTNQTGTLSVTPTTNALTAQQWQKNGIFIAGATNLTYTTPPVTLADDGAQFSIVVTNLLNPATVVTSSVAVLTVHGTPGIVTMSFPTTALASGVGPSSPANGAVSIAGSQLLAGDTVVLDATVANTTAVTGDNWGSFNLNQGGSFGLIGAKLGVLLRTGNSAGLTCDLYVNAVGPTHFTGTGEINTNRVVINLFPSQAGSTTNMGYLVQIDQGNSGSFTSSLSGTNLTFTGNAINLTFTAHNAGELYVQNQALTGIHLQLSHTNFVVGAPDPTAVTVDTVLASNVPPTFNPGFTYASSDPTVATVSGSGQLNTVGPGTATITLTVGIFSDSKTIMVTNNPGNLLAVRVVVTNQMLVNTTQSAAVRGDFVNVSDVNLLTYGSPTLTAANTNVLMAANSGVISAIAPGATFVNASYGGLTSANASITVTFPTNRFIFDTFSDGFWIITNAANGQPLTVNASGASQEIYTNGATDQQFELLYNYQNSTFRLRQRSSWLGVGSKNGGTTIGTGVTTVNYSAQNSQQWYFVDAGNGLYRIINKASNLELQTDNGNPANVTLAGAWTNTAQLWGFSYQTHFPKKGSAGYEGDYAQFGLNWAYNYNDNTGVSLPASVNFVPMIYANQTWEPLSDAQSRDAGWLAQPQPDYLLAYNEPDNATQSNTSTNAVVNQWPQIQALNVPIVSPAVQNTFDSWEYNFFSLIAGNSYRVDYTAAHEYVPPNASSLMGVLQSVYSTFGRPVWLTEFSPVDWGGTAGWTEDDDFNFLAEFMWLAEGNEWLKRYSIFPFSGTNPNPPYTSVTAGYRGNFFLADGASLTPYGELYSTWDGNTTLQTRTPYMIHSLGTSFRLTSTNAYSSPQPATIYTRDASAQWALLSSPTANQYYIISLKDGRRLRNNGGTPDLAPYGTTGNSVQWWMNGPDSKGYYYIDNLSASQSIRATGTAPAISFSMINDPAPSTATQWRLVKPYQPVAIVTVVPPSVVISYTSQSATLSWSGNSSFYNVYRSTNSGGGYIKIANLITNLTYSDSAVQNGIAYYYVITALNILGEESAYSNEVIARPASIIPQPISFNLINSGGQNGIQLNWPSDHIGWRLMANTNNLGNPSAWFAIPNSAATNQMWLPFDPAQTSAFFRLIYP